MPQQISVPQTVPNAPQFQVPTDLINAYMARRQQAEQDALNRIQEFGTTLNTYHQQGIQNKLNALKVYADIAGTSGVTTANQMAPNIPGGMDTRNLPTDPFADNSGQGTMSPPHPAAPTGLSESIPPQGTPQNATLPVSQDPTPSQAIALSAQVGHPDVAGHYAFHAPTPQVQDPNANADYVTPTSQRLMDQMSKNNAEIAKASHVGGSFAANRVKSLTEANAGLTAQSNLLQNAPFTPDQSRVINDPNATPQDLATTFPNGIPKEAQAAFQNTRSLANTKDQFQTSKQQQLNAKQEEIEKDYQNKNEALVNAQNAIQTALDLKKKSGASGPISGTAKSVAADWSHGAVANDTYQLNRNNELWRSALQHAVQVNRFNPQEVGFIGGGALAQPGEPLTTSIQKAANATKTIQKQQAQILAEKNARLQALGLPTQTTQPTGGSWKYVGRAN